MGIYFIAAGSSSKNRTRTLDFGHRVEDVSRFLPQDAASQLAGCFEAEEPVYLWGANNLSQLGRVRIGEYTVDVKNKEVVQVFSFCFWTHTRDARLQAHLGWDQEKAKEDRRSYTYVSFLMRPQRTMRSDKQYFQSAFGQLDNPQWLAGQRYFDDTEVAAALERTATRSVEELLGISAVSRSQVAPAMYRPVVASPTPALADRSRDTIAAPEWLQPLVREIETLRQDADHQERDHEDLVASFFVALGYQRTVDIRFRRGRVDIQISSGGQALITIEAKADWTLSPQNKDYVRQAFNYSHETGTRYVIVTNGDRYLLFDRDRGRTYDDHLVADFQLTSLQRDDIQIIERLRKGRLEIGAPS